VEEGFQTHFSEKEFSLISFFISQEQKIKSFKDLEDEPIKTSLEKPHIRERLKNLKQKGPKKTEDLFELINDFRENWKNTRRSRTSVSKENASINSQPYFDPIYMKKNRRIRKFMKQKQTQIEHLFPQLFEQRNSGRHYFVWHPHWPVFRRLYGTKLRSFFVDNSMFVNDLLAFIPELARFLVRLGVIRKLFEENEKNTGTPLGANQKNINSDEKNAKKKKQNEYQIIDADPLTDAFVEDSFQKSFSKNELKKVLIQNLKLKPRFAKLVSDFVQQSLFLGFGAGALDRNLSQEVFKKFLSGRLDPRSLLQTVRDYKYKGKYFIPVMTEDL
jgi:hypothetical protein